MNETPPTDPAAHARQFARTWADRLENAVEGRMHALNVPEAQVGSSDHGHGVAWRTFFPNETVGGSVATGGRIGADSGVLNPELLTGPYGAEAGELWARSRLADRIDAIIIHELSEAEAGSHAEALALGPKTDRPISPATRQLLRAMEAGARTP